MVWATSSLVDRLALMPGCFGISVGEVVSFVSLDLPVLWLAVVSMEHMQHPS